MDRSKDQPTSILSARKTKVVIHTTSIFVTLFALFYTTEPCFFTKVGGTANWIEYVASETKTLLNKSKIVAFS